MQESRSNAVRSTGSPSEHHAIASPFENGNVLFVLPPVRASRLHALGLQTGMAGEQLVWPKFCVVPMGWSHALDIAQTVFTGVVSDALGIDRTQLLHGGVRPPEVDGGAPAVYVDNFMYNMTLS